MGAERYLSFQTPSPRSPFNSRILACSQEAHARKKLGDRFKVRKPARTGILPKAPNLTPIRMILDS